MKHTLHRTTLAVAIAASVVSAGSAQRLNRQALKAYELGNFAEAADSYEKVVRKAGSAPEEVARYAESLRMLGRLDEAAAVFSEIGDAENPDIAYRHALTLAELGKYFQATARLSAAVRAKHPAAAQLAERVKYAEEHFGEPSAWKVSNEFVNSAADDFAPEVVEPLVIFASGRGGGQSQLYRSARDGNNFLRVPTLLHRVGGEHASEAPLAYARSGDLVAYTRNNFTAGERFLPAAGWELSLMLTAPTEQGDFLPGKAFPHNGSGYSTGFPSFNADGSRLYFASDRPGGEGGYDLYYAERESGGWGAPINLGPTVNTPGNEIAPHVATGAIYFASDHLPGYGGMDVYRADEFGDRITNVVNLGSGVNSPMDDVGFVLAADGTLAYLASNRAGGKGGLDLYRAVRAGTAVTFAVVDAATRQPVPNAVLDFGDCEQGVFLTGIDGSFTFRAVPNLSCNPSVRKAGFTTKSFSFVGKDLKDRQRIEIALDAQGQLADFSGKVVDNGSGNAISGATVSARHKTDGAAAESTTDQDGRYSLSLERSGDYVIEYAAPGYSRIDREIRTPAQDGADILATFAMFPVSGVSNALAANTPVNPASVPAEASNRGGTDTSLPTDRSPNASRKGQQMIPGSVEQGFAIQVAAVKLNVRELADYQSRLSKIGQVYGRASGELMRVRVGPFPSREAAAPILARVRSAGFADAFLATEDGGSALGLDRVAPPVTEGGSASPQPDTPVPNSDTAATPSSTVSSLGTAETPTRTAQTPGAYMIRLATFSSLANFDQAKASALGNLTTRRSGEYVVVLLQGYKDAGAAQSQIEAVRRGGFPDAHVVEEQVDGSLKIVR